MSPEELEALRHRGWWAHSKLGKVCVCCDNRVPCPTNRLLDLLPASGEALVNRDGKLERRSVVAEYHEGTQPPECYPGELILVLRRPSAPEEGS